MRLNDDRSRIVTEGLTWHPDDVAGPFTLPLTRVPFVAPTCSLRMEEVKPTVPQRSLRAEYLCEIRDKIDVERLRGAVRKPDQSLREDLRSRFIRR